MLRSAKRRCAPTCMRGLYALVSDVSSNHGGRHVPSTRAGLHGLTPEQQEFRSVAMDFGTKELLPHAARWDAEKHFPIDTLRKAAALGFAGMYCSPDFGGAGLSRADAAVVLEALAYADVSTTAYLTIHNMNCYIIDRYGSPAQKDKYLPRMTSLELLSSYCLTEPNSGSDAASLQTTARKAEGSSDYILNGSKAFISGGGASDVYLVMARTGGSGPKGISCFLLEKGTPGLSFGKNEHKMGWNAQPTAAVIMEEVRVPAANMIGGEGQGFKIAMGALDGGRINIATCSVGGAQYCMDAAKNYATVRKQFGLPIADFQNTQFKLADMATAIHACRLMVMDAAAAMDVQAPDSTLRSAMTKRFVTDACYSVCNDALQMLGGYGYLKEYAIERYLRDLRVHTILEGTNEIMRVIISRQLLKH